MYLTIYSIQKSAFEHSTSPKRYLILPLVSKIGVVLTLITMVIVGLSLVINRSLPNAGAVAFIAHYDGNADIYAQDIAQGVLVNLTNNNATNANVAFSPDSRQMIFRSSINGGNDGTSTGCASG
ncbi:MAG: hypothetical protein ABI970_23935, partial [Chloroflexota bacterium]